MSVTTTCITYIFNQSFIHSFIQYCLIDKDKQKNTPADTDELGDYTRKK